MLVIRHVAVGPFAENSYVVGCSESGEAIVVDPGGETDSVLALAETAGLRVGRVFLTHGHVDHAAACAEVQHRLRVPAQLHADDRDWLAALPTQAAMFGFEGRVEIPQIDRWHVDGDEVTVGREKGRVIHTPGHTRGSCALYFEGARQLITGDTLFAGSVGRTDLPGGDFEALERSIRERLFTLGDDVRFWPGHGPSALVGDERRSNPFVGERAVRR
jgi:glyoxylase-like metal-dependent hydrolase (beta-lactamase superfamily II)